MHLKPTRILTKNIYSKNKITLAIFKLYLRFIKLHGEPDEIAKGLVLGVIIGFQPFWGFQMISALILASIFEYSKLAAIIGTSISNPFTLAVIYPFTYYIGSKILDLKPQKLDLSFNGLKDIIQHSPEIFMAMAIGGVVLCIPFIYPTYRLAYSMVKKYRERKKIKRFKKLKKTINSQKAENAL